MSADKLQAVHEALADAFNESNLNAVGTENSRTSFDHETLSEVLSGSRLNSASPVHSFARFDHAALMELLANRPQFHSLKDRRQLALIKRSRRY